MKFIPDYPVMYHNERHIAGKEFEIDPADAEEMKRHGTVRQTDIEPPPEKPENDPPAKKAGRPKKS